MAVLGANLAGLTCAYYLALAGATVDVLEVAAEPDLPASARADLTQVLAAGVRLLMGAGPEDRLARANGCEAVYVAGSFWLPDAPALLRPGGTRLAQEGGLMDAASLVAAGRSAAVAIYEALQEGLS